MRTRARALYRAPGRRSKRAAPPPVCPAVLVHVERRGRGRSKEACLGRLRRREHAQRQKNTRKCLTVALPPQFLCFCQIKAWNAGNKGECALAGSGAGTRTAAKPRADQMCVLEILEQLADWRGVAAQERTDRAVAAVVLTLTLMPGFDAGLCRCHGTRVPQNSLRITTLHLRSKETY
jgi:hypothetical protein